MTKYTSLEAFLRDRHIRDPDIGAQAAEDSRSDTEAVLTDSVLTDEEDAIDTSMMDFEELEALRGQDPFMYHSIVQYQRRRFRKVTFDDVDDNDPRPNFAFEHQEESRIIPIDDLVEETEVKDRINLSSNVTNVEASICATDPEQGLPSARRLERRRSQSLHPVRAPSTNRMQRRFSQSFSCFTTGVVTRQRRVTTECHSSLIIAESDVLSSLSNWDLTNSCVDSLLPDNGGDEMNNAELDALFSD